MDQRHQGARAFRPCPARPRRTDVLETAALAGGDRWRCGWWPDRPDGLTYWRNRADQLSIASNKALATRKTLNSSRSRRSGKACANRTPKLMLSKIGRAHV